VAEGLRARRRGVVVFYLILGLGIAILIALPAVGLWHISRETERSHGNWQRMQTRRPSGAMRS